MRELDNKYNKSSNAEKKLITEKEFLSTYSISDLFLDDYDYSDWFVPPLEVGKKVAPTPTLKGDNEVKKESDKKT